ncbi:MAG TPA: LOG family protein, partial [Terriglobia bacterium]|nr:LOG family protein [Terriglobia bacterium]
GGRSVGCNIRLPQEQEPNPYLDRFVTIDHFFVRKVMLFKYSYAFIMLPGGFGTMDEFFEALTLIQTGKIQNFPLVVMGTEYWSKLRELVDGMLKAGTISAADTKLLFYTDSVEEAAAFIAAAVQEFGIISPPNPLKILGESPLKKEPARQPMTRG